MFSNMPLVQPSALPLRYGCRHERERERERERSCRVVMIDEVRDINDIKIDRPQCEREGEE